MKNGIALDVNFYGDLKKALYELEQFARTHKVVRSSDDCEWWPMRSASAEGAMNIARDVCTAYKGMKEEERREKKEDWNMPDGILAKRLGKGEYEFIVYGYL